MCDQNTEQLLSQLLTSQKSTSLQPGYSLRMKISMLSTVLDYWVLLFLMIWVGTRILPTYVVKKANARMELLRKVASFGTPQDDLKTIYILFIRSILEQSATVWHSSLTEDN